ncbi:MAG TPA: radical SAM protein [Thermoplasmata archaeon]|nr:radical SAM protein [Thermoplasmata archaeon]
MARAFSRLRIWDRVGDGLPWYLAVAEDRMPAKYLIGRRIPCDIELRPATEDALWAEQARATDRFLEAWSAIRRGELRLSQMPPACPSLVDLTAELVSRMLGHCTFCRWTCRVDRTAGVKRGTCQLKADSCVSSYFAHRGEELIFRGTHGSGTVFFTSCNMRCQFCQNADISHDKENGVAVNPQEVAAMAWQLRKEGCHNINWVGGEPTVHLHTIVEAIRLLGRPPNPEDLAYVASVHPGAGWTFPRSAAAGVYEGEFNAPMLWNSNFFMSEATMRILRPLVDVWLPDFKFGNDKCAVFLARTPWYWETVARNHKLIYDWGEDLVIRHLILPGHVECCTKRVLDWIANNTPRALVNVMDQYRPEYACDPFSPAYDERYRALSRRPDTEEIRKAYAYARNLGLRFEELSYENNVTGLRA